VTALNGFRRPLILAQWIASIGWLLLSFQP